MRWLRAIAVWALLMSLEVVHGVARTRYLAPVVGDFQARQLAVFSGSLLILSIACLTIRWLRVISAGGLVSIGGMWMVLTLAFEIGLGRRLGYTWDRIASDYNLLDGGLMIIGLAVMAMAPWIASRIRRLPGPATAALTLMLVAIVASPRLVGSVDGAAVAPAQSWCHGAALAAIRGLIDGARHPLMRPLTSGEQQQLRALYAPDADAPIWIDTAGRPNPDAREALTLFTDAHREGLEPSDYDAATLEGWAARLDAGAATVPAMAAFEVLLSLNTLAYLRQLHAGRVDPRDLGFRMSVPVDGDDFVALLRAARRSHRLAAAAADLAPPLVLYRGLRGMLARYRSLAADPESAWSAAPVAAVHPGERYAELLALHRRLRALGDMPADAPRPADGAPYAGVLVDGVTRFQTRHGLQADGVIGRATQAALRVPLSWRVRQLELAMERLRWLPHLGAQRFLAVNIPMFRVWAWDDVSASANPSFGTGVIVGRALNTQTPVFVGQMRDVIFRPYWNIPPSILRHEVLPALARDPDYLQRHDMEIVSGPSDAAGIVDLSPETIAGLRRGQLRVRQRPGPKNALGLIKFVLPNDANIYLHGTPVPELFGRARRDFSHGCVRVEDPAGLAGWALGDRQEWTRDRIRAAMHGDQSRRVHLTQPITVILFYITAVVMPEDGALHFTEDLYGHDDRLDRALAVRGTRGHR